MSWIFIPRILVRCAGSHYHSRGSCSFEWLIRDLNTWKAIFSKCEYGLVYNLNNLAFVSWATSTNSTIKIAWCYAKLIKICTTSNMGKRQGKPRINSKSPNKTRLYWINLFFIKSRCILTMKGICVNISFSYGNPLVLVMWCIFVIKPFIDNNISVVTTALRQPKCFWRVSNLGGKNFFFFSIVEQTTNFTWSFGVTKLVLLSFGKY